MEPLPDSAGPQPATAPVRPDFKLPQPASWRDSPWLCALAAIIGTGLLGAGLMALSITGYGSYGVTLFCLSPGISAFVAVLLHEWARRGTAGSTWSITGAG
ncbi:hypothetical protein [Hymenobacter bucti]|uniref:Uncharacterized protein n=1 Tax=Hymenobacter bucti TaxID=1844114 RepID=A0ABW4R0F9_9BACT